MKHYLSLKFNGLMVPKKCAADLNVNEMYILPNYRVNEASKNMKK
jgi:hypothetical protein